MEAGRAGPAAGGGGERQVRTMAGPEDDLIGIPFPEHSSELLCSLNEQRQLGVLCDVTLRSHGLEYRTHRAVLAACSLYFKKLFAGPGLGPGLGPGQDVCELDFVGPEALGALLEFAYTATLTLSRATLGEVLRAARLLEIPCVIAACVEILQGSGLEAPGPDAGDWERARRYLEAFVALPDGDGDTAEPLPPRPAARRSKKTRKFLQARGLRLNHRAEEPVLDTEGYGSSPPAPPPPSPPPAPPPLPEGLAAYEPGEEEDLPPAAFPFPYQAPLSPEEAGSDEEPMDPELMAYLSSLHHEALAPGLDGPDKLVRKRRSQMPQECPVCHKVIHGAGKLPRHMRTHTGEKPFACEVCGVRFTRNDKLKIHMRKHTGERPYSCPHCSARFLHSYDLKNHLHLHTGARPYECYLCHKAFAKDDHLQRHLKGQNCLEVRTRRRRRDDPPPPPAGPQGLDLSNGRLEGLRLSLARLWDPGRAPPPPDDDDDEEAEAEEGPQPDGAVPMEMA
ncbi:zinc finger and BTB domain-containing protein 7B isoform X2 [Alligator mississippiensis]|uniref:zinc finger and BTB domain-containing protein 7B isoform X2 n=1 Tax=Alligator mississippiensis TaxID=8496 RepID=UPI002877578D|nr:zinc finger and BTB domain-containing protein 7B isoform X2 [Alligator mississippiensis]